MNRGRIVRWCALALAIATFAGCGGDGSDGARTAALGGDAFPFNVGADARLPDARISVLEHPERSMVTGDDGHFVFDGLAVGEDATLVLEHPDYHRIQTGTIRLEAGGAERVTFQAVNPLTYWGMGLLIGTLPDERNKCQMVTTVTRIGKSLYDEGAHGEAGATVTLDPPLPPENGPIYFGSNVLPDPSLTATSDDGGVVFVQVPPGEYTWTASKPGVRFTQVRMKCRAGWLVNASPPWGLQALE